MAEERLVFPGRARGMRLRVCALALGIALAALAPPGARASLPQTQSTAPLAQWTELGPGGVVLARAVTADTRCPELIVDGGARPMLVRALPSPPAYPALVCEAEVPPDTGVASIAGAPLALPRANPRRILIVGDTGCRILAGVPVQHCDDPGTWPLAQVAESAAAWQPDLVIHVGDYVYRGAPCPGAYAGCAGSPFGDNWATWNSDFFAPAAPLLRAVPWVFTRGNHELCDDQGGGWFRLLDPWPLTATCLDYTEPFALSAGDLRLIVMDVSLADDYSADPAQVPSYAAQFATLPALAGPNTWLVQHRPLWAIGQAASSSPQPNLFRTNPTLQGASGNQLPAGVQLVVSGHLHLFELMDFADGRAPQLIVGNSGTELDPTISVPLAGLAVADTTVRSGTSRASFGYVTAERTGSGWALALRGLDGATQLACLVETRRATCAP